MADESKPIICSALTQVPAGMRRYRVRGVLAGKRQPVLYILARSDEIAIMRIVGASAATSFR